MGAVPLCALGENTDRLPVGAGLRPVRCRERCGSAVETSGLSSGVPVAVRLARAGLKPAPTARRFFAQTREPHTWTMIGLLVQVERDMVEFEGSEQRCYSSIVNRERVSVTFWQEEDREHVNGLE